MKTSDGVTHREFESHTLRQKKTIAKAVVFLNETHLRYLLLVASICNLTFDPAKERNIGYKKD